MAASTQKETITLEDGRVAPAAFPVVVSASRATDIPAFYADWFFERLKRGYSIRKNPVTGKPGVIAYRDVKFIVFWSKNPAPLLEAGRLDYLRERGIGCYVQYTLNDYEGEGLEPGLPPLQERVLTFWRLAARLGKGAVVWRFDPLLLTRSIRMNDLLGRMDRIAGLVGPFTEKLVFSFADILSYRKVRKNLESLKVPYVDWTPEDMREFARRLVELKTARGWKFSLATCAETEDLPGIEHNHCVDDRLMVRFGRQSPELLDFLGAEIFSPEGGHESFGPPVPSPPPDFAQPSLFSGAPAPATPAPAPAPAPADERIPLGDGRFAVIRKNNRDRGQRAACGCMKSRDIGEYHTCTHGCAYCYANDTPEKARENMELHLANPCAPTITGRSDVRG